MTCGLSAIALSVGLRWPPVKQQRLAGRHSFSSSGNVRCRSTSCTSMSSRMVCAHRAGLVATRETIAQPLTHDEIASPALLVPPWPLHSLKMSPAAEIQADPIVRDWFLDVGPVEDTTTMGHAAVLVRDLALLSRCSTGSTGTLPTAGQGARHEQRRPPARLSCHPQIVTRLSKCITE